MNDETELAALVAHAVELREQIKQELGEAEYNALMECMKWRAMVAVLRDDFNDAEITETLRDHNVSEKDIEYALCTKCTYEGPCNEHTN